MSILKINVKYYDRDLDDDNEEVEVEGDTLIEKVSNLIKLSVEELEDRIKSGKWKDGGEWKQKKNKLVFKSDTHKIFYSL